MNTGDKYVQFKKDMEKAGYHVRHWDGNIYNGPAVFVPAEQLQDVIRATNLRLRWDTLVTSYVVYLDKETKNV